ncbi:MAG: hypothetical protein M1831_004168 [Alyxoria varia]|nr:MAG: hypothetical protein M1831_004168 [Alyxoria varia]
MSRNPTVNTLAGVSYHAGDISSASRVHQIIAKIQPTAIVLTASAPFTADERQLSIVNIQGCKNVLDSARSVETVEALIYTSSVSVMDGVSFNFITEDAPLKSPSCRTDAYGRSKAIADRMVLDANDPTGLKTACIRPAGMYGDRDSLFIPLTLENLRAKHHKIQIGDNTNLIDVVSASNNAHAHVLALDALLGQDGHGEDSSLKVDGESFFITDDDPISYYDIVRKIWATAGVVTPLGEVKVLPAWLMLPLASLVEWLYWVLSIGFIKPATFRRELLEYTCRTRTFSIEKAKRRIGYSASKDRDSQIHKGVEWARRIEQGQTH